MSVSKSIAEDKKNEAECLMDGAWTGHPDQNEIAVRQFPYPNQQFARKPSVERYPDLRPVPPVSEELLWTALVRPCAQSYDTATAYCMERGPACWTDTWKTWPPTASID